MLIRLKQKDGNEMSIIWRKVEVFSQFTLASGEFAINIETDSDNCYIVVYEDKNLRDTDYFNLIENCSQFVSLKGVLR